MLHIVAKIEIKDADSVIFFQNATNNSAIRKRETLPLPCRLLFTRRFEWRSKVYLKAAM